MVQIPVIALSNFKISILLFWCFFLSNHASHSMILRRVGPRCRKSTAFQKAHDHPGWFHNAGMCPHTVLVAEIVTSSAVLVDAVEFDIVD